MKDYTIDQMLPILSDIYKSSCTYDEIGEDGELVQKTVKAREFTIPLLYSNPGIGKNQVVKELGKLAKKLEGGKVVHYVLSGKRPDEISGMSVPDYEDKKMTVLNYDMLESLEDGDILYLDELLNSDPYILKACLTLLDDRKTLSGKELPDIMIIASGNPQGRLPMLPQIKERFVWYNIVFDNKSWMQHIFTKHGLPQVISKKLANQIESEKFKNDDHNFNSGRSIDKAIMNCIMGIKSDYDDLLIPILSSPVMNDFEDIVFEDKTLHKGELMSWLELKQRQNGNFKK